MKKPIAIATRPISRAPAATLIVGLAIVLALAPTAPVRGEPAAAAERATQQVWVYGGRIWTDMDGDGLSECGPASPLVHDVGDTIAVDVWIDAESFEWNSFTVYVEWVAEAFEFVSASYLISGGQNWAPDVWPSGPEAVGFTGFSYVESGITSIGRVHLRYEAPVNGCVFPLLDESYWAELWSEVSTNDGDRLFFNATATSCVDPAEAPRAAPHTDAR